MDQQKHRLLGEIQHIQIASSIYSIIWMRNMDVNFKEEKMITAFENKAHRRLLEIIYRLMKTNRYVNDIILKLVGKSNLYYQL